MGRQRLWLAFSFLTFGDSLSFAGGVDFLDAAPQSPLSDFGDNSSAHHQLAIFISSCFRDVETIFSTAENMKMESGMCCPEQRGSLSRSEHGRGEQSS